MQQIDEEERARRLGNVAAILIELARRIQAAEAGKEDKSPPDGDKADTGGSYG